MTAIMTKESAVLEGAFLSADKLCRPASLSSVQKAEWNQVGKPILQAVGQICRQDEPDSHPDPQVLNWKKRIICIVWQKLLCAEAKEDVEETWRENSLFCLQNSLPEVNSVVLLELVKSTAAAKIFANFLLHLPLPSICIELKRLAQHVRSDPKREEDVQFLLDVWRELWKGKHETKVRDGECIEIMFASHFARLSSKSCSLSPQAAKRLKLDTPGLPASSANTDVLHILLHTLKDMTDQVSSTDLCFQSLSVSLDALYTSFLIDQEVILSVKEKLCILCKFISAGGKKENVTAELVHEAQRNLHASHSPSQFQPNVMKLGEALKIITELAQCWRDRNVLNICDGSVSSNSVLQLEQSIQRVVTALEVKHPTAVTEKNILEHLLTSLAFPTIESSPEVHAKVITTIIRHRLEDYKNVAVLFATETSLDCDERWMDCLERNQAAFQQHGIVVSLSSTLMTKLHGGSSDVGRNRKLMKIIADIFSALSLEDKNKALGAMVRLSSRGFFGGSVPSAVTQGFEQELNMAFNCIIQGGGGTPAAVSQGTLTTAVSLVARVAFQNPEAALRSCCHSAVFNKGAFSIVGQILQQLPGLRGQSGVKDEEETKDTEGKKHVGRNAVRACSLLCRCLKEMLRNKSLSANDKEQFVKFVGLLMLPDAHEEQGRSFLSPQEVVNNFVLPNISAEGRSSVNTDLGLQLLHIALSMDIQEPQHPSCHWMLNCSPVPLLYILAQLYNQASRCWDQPQESTIHLHFMSSKELLVSILTRLGQVVGSVVEAVPSKWSRALFWLYNKMEELDWTARFYLKPVWGQHFKNEVPSSLLAVCDLPEQDWSGLDLPQYGQGTGLLAWLECCCVSDSLKSTMLSCLSLDQRQPDHVNMFSKGLLVALTQILPWCSISQWTRLLRVLRELITSGRLNVPFSLEYVDYLPLLDLRQFSCDLRLSVLLLRVFQLLCGSSCSHWLSASGCSHVSRLYAHAVRDIINSVKAKLPLSSPGAAAGSASISLKPPASIESSPCHISLEPPTMYEDPLTDSGNSAWVSRESHLEIEGEAAPSQEVLFVLSQLFCHVQHIQVMIPGGQSESLFLCSLEILSHYEATMATFPDSCGPLECNNTRHFFSTITDNLDNQEMKAVLLQKIAQLVSSAA
ncbi:gem-associated protein 4 [Cololabis saira]|uniref:gem-associated protein 4 n=1 Tax=Cololabis saira TaxID=129043 RepID=UPI002AD44464|nr:gem-associated protein 4 [Cololabis saira]